MKQHTQITAIIPAYNEETRIPYVIQQIQKIPHINQIIVVDDGSEDNTFKVTKQFPEIDILRNVTNKGKAYSMDRGVKISKNTTLFFCDADLKGLKTQDIINMIEPVLRGKYDMYLGIRRNKMQRIIKTFALNTGERVIKREIWEKIPDFYKYRYRIESGLNFYVKHYGKGFGYTKMEYFQTLKEKKYGFFQGMKLRWSMNYDVTLALGRAYLYDLPKWTLKKNLQFGQK